MKAICQSLFSRLNFSSIRGGRSSRDPQALAKRRQAARIGCAIEGLESRQLMSGSLLVTNGDDRGPGTLRQAILDANAVGGDVVISFRIPSQSAVAVINPSTVLPTLTAPGIIVDGNSETRFLDGRFYRQLPSQPPGVRLSGSVAPLSVDGLTIAAPNCIIRGLSIGGFRNGVHVFAQSRGTSIGLPNAGNVISGNLANGVLLEGAIGVLVQGNRIGLDRSGTAPEGNGADGVALIRGASGNTIGGFGDARNVISGNLLDGIGLSDLGTSGNIIVGNLIGTAVNGLSAVGNKRDGVRVALGVAYNTIGGPSAGNIISGNAANGILLDGAVENYVSGNWIGLDSSGAVALGNGAEGVSLVGGARANTIGAQGDARDVISGGFGEGRNVISGNRLDGVGLFGAGTIPNGEFGIALLNGAKGSEIGGRGGNSNLIAGNSWGGILVRGPGTSASRYLSWDNYVDYYSIRVVEGGTLI